MNNYMDSNDFNKVIYHQRSTDAENRMKELLENANKFLVLCGSDYEEVTECELFIKCLAE